MIKFNFSAAKRHIRFGAFARDAERMHNARNKHIVVIEQREGTAFADAAHGGVPDLLRRFPVEAKRKLRQNFPDRPARLDCDHAEAVGIFRISAPVTADDHAAVSVAVQMIHEPVERLHHPQRLRLGNDAVVNIMAIEIAEIDVHASEFDQLRHHRIQPCQLDRLQHALRRALCDLLKRGSQILHLSAPLRCRCVLRQLGRLRLIMPADIL